MNWSPLDDETRGEVRTKTGSGSTQGFILGLCILGLAAMLLTSPWDSIPDPQKPDNAVVVVDDDAPQGDDDAPQGDKPSLADTVVIRIYESKNNEGWFADQARNDKFWLIKIPEMGVGLEYMDPFSDEGEPNMQATTFVAAAEARGLDPKKPFWLHVKKGSGTVLSATPFSKDVNAEQWEAIIRNSCRE